LRYRPGEIVVQVLSAIGCGNPEIDNEKVTHCL